jgi:ATP-binding cassette subfamily B multidrug efflux pump
MQYLKRLLPYVSRHKFLFWGGMSGLLLARVFEALIPLYLKDGIDSIVDGTPDLAGPALAILGCVAARFLAVISSRRLIRRIGIWIAFDLRRRTFTHLMKMGPGFFTKFTTGDLMARAINDISLIRQLSDVGTRTVLVLLFCAAVGIFFMLRLSPMLAILILPPLPVIAYTAYHFSKRIFQYSMKVQEGFADLSEFTQENLNGIRTVQAHVQEEEEIKRFEKRNTAYADNFVNLVRTNSLLGSTMPALGALCLLMVLGYGGSRVLAGEMSVGTFAAFFWYLNMVLLPVRETGNMVTLWQQGATGAQRLFEILDTEPEIKDNPAEGHPERLTGEILLQDLSYTYPFSETPALRNISLEIHAGETVAVLGRVGSGKSTLLQLLVRLLDPPPGTLILDGHDVRSYPLALIRNQVALVLQDPFMFAETLRINLSYDDPDRPVDEVWSAAEAADLMETIRNFSDQMETMVGERGVTLSGGQKQRSTLSRGLIRKSPVLVLDDCFSNIDTETEANILNRLKELRKGRTTILVSHRVSTVRHADCIVVMEDGCIVEKGSHEELVAEGGVYAHIEEVQNSRGRLLEKLEGSGKPGGAAE